jgi:hypothetical protein
VIQTEGPAGLRLESPLQPPDRKLSGPAHRKITI